MERRVSPPAGREAPASIPQDVWKRNSEAKVSATRTPAPFVPHSIFPAG